MSKKIKNTTTNNIFNIVNTGITCSATFVQPNIITFNNKNQDELLRIEPDGKIYYRTGEEMIQVNCTDDIGLAFSQLVFNLTGFHTQDYVIDNYINNIINCEKSSDSVLKLEKAFRKIKLGKINKI